MYLYILSKILTPLERGPFPGGLIFRERKIVYEVQVHVFVEHI